MVKNFTPIRDENLTNTKMRTVFVNALVAEVIDAIVASDNCDGG